MAFGNADITKNSVRQTALRLGITLGWLCLAAARATADAPATPSLTATPGQTAPAIPLPFNGLQPHQPGQATDLMSRLTGDSSTPFSIPLNVQFGQHSGVSFLYNLAAAPQDGQQNGQSAPRAATYGFSNALALGHDVLHLNGLMYMAGGQAGSGQSKTSQLISQALAFENKGWKFDAHYQSVGKDFGSGSTIKDAAGKLGFASNLTDDMAKQLEGLRGQNDLGFSLAHADAHGNFGFLLKENDNSANHLKTTEQTLSLARSFAQGVQFEAGRDTVSAKPTDGDLSKALTTTTNHLKLGMDRGKGLSFSAEANLIGDTQGRAEQHLAYHFADQLQGAQLATSFQTNSVKANGSSAGTSDQTLGMDFNRQAKGLGLKASFLQFASTTTGGQSLTKTTEHLELGLKDTQVQFNLLGSSSKNSDGTTASDKTLNLDMVRQTKGLSLKASLLQFSTTAKDGQGKTNENLELNWQARKDVTVGAHWTQASLLTNSTGKTETDKNLGIDVARQGKGLTWKASFLQDTPTADGSQAKTTEHFEMDWQARKDLTLQGHWNHAATQIVHATAPDEGANRDEQRDLTATLNSIRLHGLRHSQAVVSLAQCVSQGKTQSDTRALRFDTDMPDTHVHLEYMGSALGWDTQRNSLVSRAIRVASIAPGDWMHYSAYYKQRSQTLGGHLPDIRDYQVGMTLKHITLAYHYMNQQEQPDNSVKDTVESHYQMDGPLTKKLAWNVQYDQTNDHSAQSGLESWLVGFKSLQTSQYTLEAMIGRPELRVDGLTVPGETFKLTFICKMDEADTVAFNGEVTNWARKTKQTPSTVDGKVRLDLAKGF